MKEAPSRQRLFVALDLPEEAREQIVAWQHEALGGHGRALRLVRPAALHVTLVFLGHRAEDPIGVIAEAAFGRLASLDVEAPEFEVVDLRGIPPRRPRLWAVGLSDADGRGASVQKAVAAPLAEQGLYTPEQRPFWAHVTVARLRAGARPPHLDAPPPPGRFVADTVVLYRSRLSRAGAEYEPLASVRLRAPGS